MALLSSSPDVERLAAIVDSRRSVVLSGAGCSTESGIPDYRGVGTARRAHNPLQYRAFMADALARARYWARSFVGWPRFAAARPNAAHHALAELERPGRLVGVITQNVDRLHQGAGSKNVVELHGALAEVRCLSCDSREPREALQQRLAALNPRFFERGVVGVLPDGHMSGRRPAGGLPDGHMSGRRPAGGLPDGDVDLPVELVADFRVPSCRSCGGTLKPDVVFFGENVPKRVVEEAGTLLRSAEALLVVGSSLAVFSGFRFVREAKRSGMPVAIVNVGPTRGDALCDVRVEQLAGQALSWLAARSGSS